MSDSNRSQGLSRKRPRYREAYPQLDVLNALRSFNKGQTICDFADSSGEKKGVAKFDRRGDRCQLQYHFHFPQTALARDWVELELAPVSNGFTDSRVMVVCPVCSGRKRNLYFRDAWSCASCAELLCRVQLIHPDSRKWEKLDRLSRGLERGKPHGMHSKTYSNRLSDILVLKNELYEKPRVYASNKYADIVSSTWRLPVSGDDFWFPSPPMPPTASAAPVRCAPVGVGRANLPARHGDYETKNAEDL